MCLLKAQMRPWSVVAPSECSLHIHTVPWYTAQWFRTAIRQQLFCFSCENYSSRGSALSEGERMSSVARYGRSQEYTQHTYTNSSSNSSEEAYRSMPHQVDPRLFGILELGCFLIRERTGSVTVIGLGHLPASPRSTVAL